ncbi:MAG TPA: hypothetical protein VFP98_06140, partial [Candidatus Polarisedimenticolia bacterium]|nr:hypothetical protein [Candidatus Polarisedimenticolia bacterium]
KAAAREKAKGTWYLKTNAPYLQGRHAYGTYKKPVVMVSPAEGVQIGKSAEVEAGVFTAKGRRLVLRVNDPVKIDEFEWESEDSTLELELEGTGRAEGPGVIMFTNLKSLADFEKCWNEAFSEVSIETKYDWPDDIRKMVVAREVKDGMTPEQVMVAVGTPERVTRSKNEAGKDVEVWVIQQGEGAKMGFWKMKVGDKQEMEIQFVDGRVTQIGAASEQPAVKLK